MANKKMNSHTSPIFKTHNILKLEDLFRVSCLKMHYRIERGLAAPVFRSLQTRNWEVHNHNTRQREIRIIHPNFETNKNCFRFFLPMLLNEVPSELLERLHDVTLKTFSYHLKRYFIDQYRLVCTKSPCQPCGRLPLL